MSTDDMENNKDTVESMVDTDSVTDTASIKRLRKAYIDIEACYDGDIDPDGSKEDRERFFKDFPNWKFYCEKEHNGKKVWYRGIIGILILDFELDSGTNIYRFKNKRFVQLIGEEISKERMMKELDGITDVIGYHCRTKPSGRKRYIGYDFGVINAQLGVVLDDLPGVECTDLEISCHGVGMYGGLKAVEKRIEGVPPRKSGISDGSEEEKLLLDIAACEDEDMKKEMWKRAKLYNREDVVNLVYIEQHLRKLV